MRIEDLLFDARPTVRVIDEEGEHGTAEILGRAALVGRSLASSGVKIGDTVALFAENGVGFIVGLFGVLACGATAVIVDPALPFKPVRRILMSSRAAAVCSAGPAPRQTLNEHRRELPALPWIEVEALGRSAPEPPAAVRRPGLSAEQAAVVLYSSGTTGDPKGVVLSHRAILSNVRAIGDYLRPKERDLFYVARAMVHSATLVGEVLLAFSSGASLFAASPRIPAAQMFRRIHEHGVTITCVNPSLLRFFAGAGATEERLRSLHTIHVSGAIVDRRVFQRVHEQFPWIRLINAYGLTEAGPRVAQLSTADALKPGSVGKAIQGVSLEVRGQDGAPCEAHAVGEVFVRSPSLLDGYLRQGGLAPVELLGGALPTGDLGYLDDDGDLFITGRKDDIIITGGHKVDPRAVEEVVEQVAGVADCIVFGVEDELLGQRVVCAYTADPAELEDDDGLSRRAREACAEALAGHQVPKSVCRWSDIPLSPGGKRSRALAQRRFLTGR